MSLGKLNQAIPIEPFNLDTLSSSVQSLRTHLEESLKMRVLNIPDSPQRRNPHDPKLAILFSGGVDCTVLARIVHDLLPVEEQIDLLNVAFENPRVALANKETL